MIYFKKKSLFKKTLNFVSEKTQGLKLCVFSFSKFGSFLFLFFIIALYASYLFLTPKVINDNNVEKIINSYLLKNSKLTLDIPNLSVSPDYKFNIKINADSLSLNYPNKQIFVEIKEPNIEINLLSLLQKNIDLNKAKAKSISINTNFTKNKTYNCFQYLNLNSNKSSKNSFKLRNINLNAEKFAFNLFDENIQKMFYIKSNDIKISSNEFKKLVLIKTKGEVLTSNHKISDFNLNLQIKINPTSSGKFKEKLAKLNYNPFKYADEYSFYALSNVDLKIYPQDKKSNIVGNIDLKNYYFTLNGLSVPKNDLLLNFKDNRVYFDSDFKFIKNQQIKIKSTISLAKNKYIEAKLSSNKINLADFSDVLGVLSEILNFKLKANELVLKGNADIDLYLKSNFKTINSKGKLLIQNAQLEHKKTGLNLTSINSNIDFNNNTINIHDTSALVNGAKFNLVGNIDTQTNLDLKANSEPMKIAQVMTLLKSLPFIDIDLNKYQFKKGLLTVNSTIKGKLEKPIINTNSTLDNIEIASGSSILNIKKINFSANPQNNVIKNVDLNADDITLNVDNKKAIIPKLTLNILENDIIIPSTNLTFENIPTTLSGQIKNYRNKQIEGLINIFASIPKENEFFIVENEGLKFNSTLNIKQNKITINSSSLFDNQGQIATIIGSITNHNEVFDLNDIKIAINQNIKIKFPKIHNTKVLARGNLVLKGTFQKPNISGRLLIDKITSSTLNLSVNNAIADIKNSIFYLDIKNGKIFDFDFNLNTQGKYQNKSLIIDFVNINSPYINVANFEKYKQIFSKKSDFKYEIDNIRGNVSELNAGELALNSLIFSGKIKDNILNLTSFDANLLNGKAQGEAQVELLNQKVKTKTNLKELNVRLLSNKLKEISIATSGKLSALVDGEFIGYNINQIISNFDGRVKFNIENGELSQFAKLERFLQAGNILSQSILKLTLNSTISAITKQNTGDFKLIEGDLKIKNGYSDINYIKTQGSNMSLYLTGYFNLLTMYANVKVLGRIPNSTVKVMGNFGNFSLNKQVEKMDDETKETIQSIAASPLEKRLSTKLSEEEIAQIPNLAYQVENTLTREFIVKIEGISNNINSIASFKWHSNQADL